MATRAAPAKKVVVKPFGRRLPDILESREGGTLRPAEQALLEACRCGEFAEIGQTRPEAATPENIIGADFLRFLILGGDEEHPVHEKGLQLRGAWIDGLLDLENTNLGCAIRCILSYFSGNLIFRDATLLTLELDGSRVPSLRCDRLRSSGSIFLRRFKYENGQQTAFEAHSEVRLMGAHVGGSLSCRGGHFIEKNGDALSCDGINIGGNLLFDENFTANGTVRMIGACIGGAVYFEGHFKANGMSLDCAGMRARGTLFMRYGAFIAGTFDLTEATVCSLVDDRSGWPSNRSLALDGFRYDRIGGGAPTTAQARKSWLMRQLPNLTGKDFRPQPWKQCIKVLREMGHEGEARDLAVKFERQRRRSGALGTGWHGFIRKAMHYAYDRLAGYGYRPMRLLLWTGAIWLVCALAFLRAADKGIMAPTNPLVFEHPSNWHCRQRSVAPAEPMPHWNGANCLGPNEYTTFSPWWYSLDLLLPLVDLQQDKDWSPMVTMATTPDPRGPNETWWAGVFTRWLMWFEILFGWVASLLFVAILSGLVKKAGDE